MWSCQKGLSLHSNAVVGENDVVAQRKELSRLLVTWMGMNMLTKLRLSWMSGKALAARSAITGICLPIESCVCGRGVHQPCSAKRLNLSETLSGSAWTM